MTNPILANPIVIPVNPQPIQICPKVGIGVGVLIYNLDKTNVAYAGYQSNLSPTTAMAIQPLASVIMDGGRTIWGYCPTASIELNVTPGGSYQSPSPAQIAEQLQPGIQAATSALLSPTSTFPFFTFEDDSRIWGASISGFIVAGNNFAGGFTPVTLLIATESGALNLPLALGFNEANQIESDSLALSFATPIPVNAGDVAIVNVNNGDPITNANIRGIGSILYSTP